MWDDRGLEARVALELDWDRTVDASNIGVSVSGGIVTLTGVVSSDIEREDVVKAVERVLDVEAIVDELEVSCATRERTPDRRSLEPSL